MERGRWQPMVDLAQPRFRARVVGGHNKYWSCTGTSPSNSPFVRDCTVRSLIPQDGRTGPLRQGIHRTPKPSTFPVPDVRVGHRRGHIPMTQQCLDRPDVVTPFQRCGSRRIDATSSLAGKSHCPDHERPAAGHFVRNSPEAPPIRNSPRCPRDDGRGVIQPDDDLLLCQGHEDPVEGAN